MAAENGTMNYLGKSGRTYSLDLYLPDATGNFVGFNMTGLSGSGSPTQQVIPEDGMIVDIIAITGTTCVGGLVTRNSAAVPGGALRWANQLNTLAKRQSVRIPLKQGDILSITTF